MSNILEGIRVVDAASFLAGPCAATIMSDYGADVIKVEPLTGDRHRSISGGHPVEFSWQLTGRNKRSLALDITTAEGHEILLQLAKDADVLLVNFSAAQMKKYGLTWEELKAVNPKLVYAQISAYGLKGAQAERRAFDLTGWFAKSGIMDMMHNKDEAPAPPAGGVGDHATAMTLFGGIMLALFKRGQTGEGSMVDTSLAATGTWANGLNLQAVIAGVDGAARRDKEGWSSPFTNTYTCADGRHIMLGVQNIPRDWPKLASALGHPEWLEDERFAKPRAVFKNRFAALQVIADAFASLASEQACRLLDETGIVYGLVLKNAEVIDDPQLVANGVVTPTGLDEPGFDRTLPTPFNLSDETQRSPQLPPGIGEHSEVILRDAGYSDAQIAGWIAAGVVGSETNAS